MKATKRKAGHTLALERLTTERLRNILSSPGRRGKETLRNLIYDLFKEHGGGDLEETPEYFALVFESGAFGLRYDEQKGHPNAGRPVFERIVALAEEREPEEYKVARRVVEIFAGESDGRKFTAGGRLIMEAADDIMGASGLGGA